MHADQYLENIATELALPHLVFNDERAAQLIVGEDQVLELEHEADTDVIHVYCYLGPPPDQPAGLRTLLSANLFGHQTNGLTLAIDEDANETVVCGVVNLSKATVLDGVELLETLSRVASQWRGRLANVEDDEPRHLSPATDVDGHTSLSTINMLKI